MVGRGTHAPQKVIKASPFAKWASFFEKFWRSFSNIQGLRSLLGALM